MVTLENNEECVWAIQVSENVVKVCSYILFWGHAISRGDSVHEMLGPSFLV